MGRESIDNKGRSQLMSRIRSKRNKSTEIKFSMILVRAGICGWKIRPPEVFGHPDIIFPKYQLAIFIDGCFWHCCPRCGHIPKTNQEYWIKKLKGNIERDNRQRIKLRNDGWIIYRFWEHELNDSQKIINKLNFALIKRNKVQSRNFLGRP